MTQIGLELMNLERAALRKYMGDPRIDWEQRRYEIARDILAESYACNKYYRSIDIKDMVAESLEAADALTNALRGGSSEFPNNCDTSERWLSVNDAMPGDERVMFYAPPSGMLIGKLIDGIWWSSGVGYKMSDVTHWMPLPEPPKKGDEQ